MATDFRKTPLWRKTLGVEQDPDHQEAIDRLRIAYEAFRSRAAVLAEEIKTSMPMFTDHGIEHIDSLWDTASLLMDSKFPINPAEAFVLGGGFLLHDLAMGLSAYPDGAKTLKEDPAYLRALESESLTDDFSSEDRKAAEDRALVATLRLKHASQAARLVEQEFPISGGMKIQLLQDDELRSFFGEDIGRIAQSHWCSVQELADFVAGPHGIDGSLPGEWEIDPLKLACILRLADATHIDSRRAPLLLHAFRPQQGISRDHWVFQLRLNRPIVNHGRLEYTSNRAFPESESRAWWLAHDTLNMINDELRQVEALCLDLNKPTFTANSVAGIATPERLAAFVRTSGWTPIDASLRATNIDGVVTNLGGAKLYGNVPFVPMRELIANAADASKLISAYTRQAPPAIHVRLFHQGGRDWIEVTDRGIGMSRAHMTSCLLDFGSSQWRANQSDPELALMDVGDFKPRGRFGIGFFSIFMIADRVEVLSLRYLRGSAETNMLIFEDGLRNRPLFREVPARERLTSHGTTIRARLSCPALSKNGVLETDAVETSVTQMFRDRLLELCATLDVDLTFEGPDDLEAGALVRANDWVTLDASDLFDRLYRSDLMHPQRQEFFSAWRDHFVQNARNLIGKDGEVVGRAVLASGLEEKEALDVWWWPSPSAKIFVGGVYSDYIWDCIGAFVGEPLRADRNSAFPIATPEELVRWATDQMDILTAKREASIDTRYGAAELGRSVGVDLPDMPFAIIRTGELTPSNLVSWLEGKDSITLVEYFELQVYQDEDGAPLFREPRRGREIQLPDDCLLMRFWPRRFFPEEIVGTENDARFGDFGPVSAETWNPAAWWYRHGKSGPAGLLLDAVLEAWRVQPAEIVSHFERFHMGSAAGRISLPLSSGGGTALVEGYRLRRPLAAAKSED